MTIQFSCACGQEITAASSFAGRKVQCENCKKILIVPGKADPARRTPRATMLAQPGDMPGQEARGPAIAEPPTARTRPTPSEPAKPASTSVAANPSVPKPPPRPSTPAASAPDSPAAPTAEPSTPRPTPCPAPASARPGLSLQVPGNLRFRCLCGADYQAFPRDAGQPTRCVRCGQVLFVPTPDAMNNAAGKPRMPPTEPASRYSQEPDVLTFRGKMLRALLVLVLIGAIGTGVWLGYGSVVADGVKADRLRVAEEADRDHERSDAMDIEFLPEKVHSLLALSWKGLNEKIRDRLLPSEHGSVLASRGTLSNLQPSALEKAVGDAGVERVLVVRLKENSIAPWVFVQTQRPYSPARVREELKLSGIKKFGAARYHYVGDRLTIGARLLGPNLLALGPVLEAEEFFKGPRALASPEEVGNQGGGGGRGRPQPAPQPPPGVEDPLRGKVARKGSLEHALKLIASGRPDLVVAWDKEPAQKILATFFKHANKDRLAPAAGPLSFTLALKIPAEVSVPNLQEVLGVRALSVPIQPLAPALFVLTYPASDQSRAADALRAAGNELQSRITARTKPVPRDQGLEEELEVWALTRMASLRQGPVYSIVPVAPGVVDQLLLTPVERIFKPFMPLQPPPRS